MEVTVFTPQKQPMYSHTIHRAIIPPTEARVCDSLPQAEDYKTEAFEISTFQDRLIVDKQSKDTIKEYVLKGYNLQPWNKDDIILSKLEHVCILDSTLNDLLRNRLGEAEVLKEIRNLKLANETLEIKLKGEKVHSEYMAKLIKNRNWWERLTRAWEFML